MTVVINDPGLWPIIDWNYYSYWTVLTLEQEIRYIGIPHSVSVVTISANALPNIPFVSLLDAGCNITDYIRNGTNFVVTVMLGGSTIGDCFRVLIQSHVLYFASSVRASFVGVYCLQFGLLSPALVNSDSTGVQISVGTLQILLSMQLFVLGPRLILSIREFNANLVADSDAETSMASIVFQERVHVLTSSTV
ncbi:hypothetical protein BD769DRAFT_1392585 [Suillus cothurnatus]|nr:hypothetical protein BD769DRAFT_1392585 [Suillus cothurnatus]